MPEISRRQFAVYLVVVVLVVLLGGRALRADRGPAGAVQAPSGGFTAVAGPEDGATGSGASGPSGRPGVEVATTPERLLVHVAGAVRRPGVYELQAGARVADAVTKAGGGRAGAALDVLNLAAKVTDGQQVLVARRSRSGTGVATGVGVESPVGGDAGAPGAAGGGPGSSTPAGSAIAGAATVNVNQADAIQLEVLDGVGPAIAAKIVSWRTQNGPFKTVDDLALVPGIGPKKLEAIRAQATT